MLLCDVIIYRPVRLAVIAKKYTNPGANATIKGIHTGHASAGLAMLERR